MAPFSAMTAGVSLLAKSFTVFCSNALARPTRVLPAPYLSTVKCLTSATSGPPKKPMNGYLRYFIQEKPTMTRQNPDTKPVYIIKKISQQWNAMSAERKRPFEQPYLQAMEKYKADLQKYRAQLTPAQVQEEAMEKREKMAKRKAIRRKRELNILGKPKGRRSAFNIFMSEHYQEATGVTAQVRMKMLVEDWRNLSSQQKQVYTQLAEDDFIRKDLIREKTLFEINEKEEKPKKVAKKAKAKVKVEKKATRTGMLTSVRKTATKKT
ncbi:transcription factor A, mitochondrial-like [Diretmus argenteus]